MSARTSNDPTRRSVRVFGAGVYRRRRLTAVGVLVAIAVIVVLGVGHSTARSVKPSRPTAATSVTALPTPIVHAAAAAVRDARAVDDVLAHTPYVTRGRARVRDVAITFDDGPGPSTPALLHYLTAHSVPATFFLVGREIAARPRIVGQEIRDGFSLGTHTESHPMLASRSSHAQSAEILDTAARITRLGGGRVRLFRPPYGSFDATTLGVLRAARMLMVLWSVDSKDYAARSPAPIVYTALSGARAGTIILMHDGPIARPNTIAALRVIVPALRAKGYRLVSIPTLLADDPPPRDQSPPHALSGG